MCHSSLKGKGCGCAFASEREVPVEEIGAAGAGGG